MAKKQKRLADETMDEQLSGESAPVEEEAVVEPDPAQDPERPMSKEEALGLIGEGEPPDPAEGPMVEQSAPIERYPVDSDLWGPVNAAFCELCKRYGLPKGHQDVLFDRKTGSFVILERPED